uniref:Uncharacterized protein n=1 Tax=Fusarium oxysporum (strain Fo5176) TaxID=660025 RepID=A0A0D2XP04_FUSOF
MSENPDVSLQTLSAADGFLAGLIYLRTAKQATTQNRATDSFTHAGRTWKYLDAIWFSLESVRNRMLELVPKLGLRGIDNTLDSFINPCGDLFQVLSGLWVTAKHQYSPSSALKQARPQSDDVKSCTQRMRQDESFQDPFSLGILSIVDTFIQLGYLQTPEDVQEYMILVGKVQKRKIDDECSATDTWT